MNRLLVSLLVTPLLALPLFVQAGCPVDLIEHRPQESWAELYQRLIPHKQVCYENPDYLALLGAASLRSTEPREAALLLERSLMLDPLQAGAAVDYAQALYLLQQPYAALDLNQQLIDQAEQQPPLREYLRQRQKQWDASLSQHLTTLYAQAGYDTNLGRVSDLSSLNLTLPDGTLSLSLSPDQQATAGGSVHWGVQQYFSRQLVTGLRQVHWQLEGRDSPNNAYDRLEARAGVAQSYHWQQHSLRAELDVTHLSFGHRDLYSSLASGLTYAYHTAGACTPLTSGSVQLRRFPSSHLLDGTQIRLSFGAQCQYSGVNLLMMAGPRSDLAAEGARVGGDRFGYDAVLQARVHLAGGEMTGGIQHMRLLDQRGYSSLLNYNERRVTRTTNLQLSYHYPLDTWHALTLDAQHVVQRSNLELFDLNASELRLGWRLQF